MIPVEQVIAELRSLDLEAMQSALCIAHEYDDPRIADALLEVLPQLRVGNDSTPAQIIGLLGALGEQRAVRPILDFVDQDLGGFDHQIQEHACQAFTSLGAVAALPFLRTALAKWSYHERPVAEAIVAIGGAAEATFFESALASRQGRVQIAAIDALASLGAREALPKLERLVTSKKPDVRSAAIVAVVKLDPARAPLLATLLDEAKGYADKLHALRLIGSSGVTAFAPRLVDKLADTRWCDNIFVHFDVLDALGRLGHAEHVAMLEQFARDGTPWNRVAATARLVALGRTELAAALLECLRTIDYAESGDDTWNWIIETFGHAADALAASKVHHVAFIELMNDIRRERLPIRQAGVREKAAKLVREVVGSDVFSDYDRWRTSQPR